MVFSNYDCLNSHWCHDYGNDYTYDGMLKSIIDFLYLNPAKVKKAMIERGWEITGKWSNLKYRDGKEYVEYSDFIQELENNVGCSLINFFGVIDLTEFLEIPEPKKILISKGTPVGLLDNSSGSGSVWEMKLKRDMTIRLDKPYVRNDSPK